MIKIIRLTCRKDLEKYFKAIPCTNVDSGIWFRYPNDKEFQILNGFTLGECVEALRNNVEFIWVEW